MENKVGQKVWFIELTKSTKPEGYKPNGIKVTEHEIIAISSFRLCINTDWFKTFSFTKEGERKQSYSDYLNETKISIRTNDNLLGNGVFATLYTTKKPTKKTIDKIIAECCVKIDRDYGWLLGSAKEELYEMADSFSL